MDLLRRNAESGAPVWRSSALGKGVWSMWMRGRRFGARAQRPEVWRADSVDQRPLNVRASWSAECPLAVGVGPNRTVVSAIRRAAPFRGQQKRAPRAHVGTWPESAL